MEAWSVLGATEAAKVYVARGDAILPAGEEQRRINAAQLPRGKPRAALAKERQKKRKEGWQTLPPIDERPIGEIRAARRKEKILQKRPRTRKRGKGPKARPRWFKDTRPGLSASEDDDSASDAGSGLQEGSKSPTPRPLIRTQRNSSSIEAANATPSDEDMGETSDEGGESGEGGDARDGGDASNADADAEAEDGEDGQDSEDGEDGEDDGGSGEDAEDASGFEDESDEGDASARDSSNSSDSSEDPIEINIKSSVPARRTARRSVQVAEDIDEDDPSIICTWHKIVSCDNADGWVRGRA